MSEESKRKNSKFYRHRIIKAEVPRFETPDNITTANLNISRYRFYDLFAHTLISLMFIRILRYSTQLRLMIAGSSLARTIHSRMRERSVIRHLRYRCVT